MCTPQDPVSHEKGVSLYSAVYRGMVGTFTKSWEREVERLTKVHGKDLSTFVHLTQNRMVHYQIWHASMVLCVYMVFGMGGVKTQFAFVLQGHAFVELINYMEHYGLRRHKDKSGIYESIGNVHSWSTTSSPITFRISRHSDHHAHKFRPYQIGRRLDRAPTLPLE
jgi:alkane 1-monooxygenase